MRAEDKLKTNLWVGIGLVVQVLGRFNDGPQAMRLTIMLIGGAICVYGCMCYTAGKGYGAWTGLIVLIPILGLIILVLLPDVSYRLPPERKPRPQIPAGSPMRESGLNPLQQLIFERVRTVAAAIESPFSHGIVRGGPAGAWELATKPGGQATRMTPDEESSLIPVDRGIVAGKLGVLSFLVQRHDQSETRLRYGWFAGLQDERCGEVVVLADGRMIWVTV